MTTPEQHATKKIDIEPGAVCPFLGLHDAPDSRFMYPTTVNFCHRVVPPASIVPAYQNAVCLNESEFPACPVYKQAWKGRLPVEIRGDVIRDRSEGNRIWLVFALMLLLAAIVVILIFGQPMISDMIAGLQSDSADGQHAETMPAEYVTETDARLVTATEALAVEVPTLAPTNTVTPTLIETPGVPTPGPDLQTPFGPDAFFLLHRVQENESLPMVAEFYNTTTEVLRLANGFAEQVNIHPDDVLVVPYGRKRITGVDAYRALFIEADTILADLAYRYATTEDTLRFWNSLGPAEVVPAGRWMIVPLVAEEREYPTVTPTPFDWRRYALKGPFGPNDEFVLHQVQVGESLSAILEIYNTTKDVTMVLNGFEDVLVIQPGQVILLMPGKRNLEAVQGLQLVFLEDEKSLVELAELYGVTGSILAEYNDLVGETVPANSWIVIP